MAKLKYKIEQNADRVKFSSLKDSEIFIHNGNPCMKTNRLGYTNVNGVNLTNGDWLILEGWVMVTQVKEAKLKLTV